jgi:ATP-dependent Clp protease ATP-binding subunit ClpA
MCVQVRKIAAIMLEETKQRVATKDIELAVGPRLLERIIQDGYSLEYGVRPLRQVGLALRKAMRC